MGNSRHTFRPLFGLLRHQQEAFAARQQRNGCADGQFAYFVVDTLRAAVALAGLPDDDGRQSVFCAPRGADGAPADTAQIVHCTQFVGVCVHRHQVPAYLGGLAHAGYATDVDTDRRTADIWRGAERLAMGRRSVRVGEYLCAIDSGAPSRERRAYPHAKEPAEILHLSIFGNRHRVGKRTIRQIYDAAI